VLKYGLCTLGISYVSGFDKLQHLITASEQLQLQNEAAVMSCRIWQSSIEGVQLDWLAHTPVCEIESC